MHVWQISRPEENACEIWSLLAVRLNSIGCNFNSESLDIVILREYNEKRALALATKMKMASLKALLVCSK